MWAPTASYDMVGTLSWIVWHQKVVVGPVIPRGCAQRFAKHAAVAAAAAAALRASAALTAARDACRPATGHVVGGAGRLAFAARGGGERRPELRFCRAPRTCKACRIRGDVCDEYTYMLDCGHTRCVNSTCSLCPTTNMAAETALTKEVRVSDTVVVYFVLLALSTALFGP